MTLGDARIVICPSGPGPDMLRNLTFGNERG